MRLIPLLLLTALVSLSCSRHPNVRESEKPPNTQMLGEAWDKASPQERIFTVGTLLLKNPDNDFRVHLQTTTGVNGSVNYALVVHSLGTTCRYCDETLTAAESE